jgi:hypothetical protein
MPSNLNLPGGKPNPSLGPLIAITGGVVVFAAYVWNKNILEKPRVTFPIRNQKVLKDPATDASA